MSADDYIRQACENLGAGALPTQIQTLVYALMLQMCDIQEELISVRVEMERLVDHQRSIIHS